MSTELIRDADDLKARKNDGRLFLRFAQNGSVKGESGQL